MRTVLSNTFKAIEKFSTRNCTLAILILCIAACTRVSLSPAEVHVLADLPGAELRNVTYNQGGNVICGELKSEKTHGEFKRFYSSWKTSHVVFVEGDEDFGFKRMVSACDLKLGEKEIAADVAATEAKDAEAHSKAAQRRWLEKNAAALDTLQRAAHQADQDNADRHTLEGR